MTGRDEFLEWARHAAHPLDGVDLDLPSDDLTPLAAMVRDARVVGVGETWHPAHEFLSIQHRVARFLIERMDFTCLLLEASLTTSRQLDAYVNGGPRTDIALSSVWDNEETTRFLDWLRAHNASVPETRRVRIFGLDLHILIMEDINQPGASAEAVIEYLSAVDPDYEMPHLKTVRQIFAGFAAIDEDHRKANFSYFGTLSAETRRCLKDAFTDAAKRLNQIRAESEEHTWALHRATTVLQAARMYEVDTARGLAIRAPAMAENARWALEQLGDDARAVILGTAVHLARAPWTYVGDDTAIPSIGMRLSRWLGSRYVALATTVSRGSFDPPHPITGTTAIPDGDPGSLDLALAELDTAPLLLDLRNAPSGWLDQPHPLRPMQNVASPTAYKLGEAFDGVIHVDEIHGARPRHGIVSHPL